MGSEDIITGKEAAHLLGVSYTHLYALIRRGLLTRLDEPGEVRENAPLRFLRSQVEDLHQRDEARRSVKKSRSAA